MTVGARLQSYCEKRLIGNGFVRPDFALPEFEFDRLGFDAEMRIRTWGGLDLTPARPGSKVRGVSPALLSAKRDFDVIMRLLPDGVRRYLRGRARRSKSVGERFWLLAAAYVEFCQERKALHAIVNAARHLNGSVSIPAVGLRVSEDDKGKRSFELKTHPLYSEVVRREVDPAYIRECENPRCRGIFWAGRTDQTGCSGNCQQAIRDRRYLGKKESRLTVTKQEKVARVRQAIKDGFQTREGISTATKLSFNEISPVLAELYDQREVDSRGGEFSYHRGTKKGK